MAHVLKFFLTFYFLIGRIVFPIDFRQRSEFGEAAQAFFHAIDDFLLVCKLFFQGNRGGSCSYDLRLAFDGVWACISSDFFFVFVFPVVTLDD